MKKNLKKQEYYENLLKELYSKAKNTMISEDIDFKKFKILISIILTRISLSSLDNNLINQLYLSIQKKYPVIQSEMFFQLIKLFTAENILENNNISSQGFFLLEHICLEEDNC